MTNDSSVDRLRERRPFLLNEIDELERQKRASGLSEQGRQELLAHNAALTQIDAALLQAENTSALNRDADGREQQKLANDDAAYWFRRFMISLQIGNGAGFLASLEAILHAEHMQAAIPLAGVPAVRFGLGVVMAGTLPAILWLQRLHWVAENPILREVSRAALIATALGAMAWFFLAVGTITNELVSLGVPWPKFL
jgi:hypothetical protein